MKGYHLTPERNLPSILEHGLIGRPCVWFFSSREGADVYVNTGGFDERRLVRGDGDVLAILEVDLDGYDLQAEPTYNHMNVTALVTRPWTTVPPERIRVVGRGSDSFNRQAELMRLGLRFLLGH